MSAVEELKKYKELLDNAIITQEEFDKKKNELLLGSPLNPVGTDGITMNKTADVPGGKNNKDIIKITIKVVVAIAVLVAIILGAKKTVEHNQHSARAAALKKEIESIMDDYGLTTYDVKYTDYSYDVYAEGFDELTNGEALALLKELDGVSVDDPFGDYEIDFGMTNVHPGLDVEYSYWRVSSFTVDYNKKYGGSYEVPGIYCNLYGNECVYECEN